MKGRNTPGYRKTGESTKDVISSMVIGQGPAMQDIITIARQVAQYPTTTVLLQGESGTGKDVIAYAIHKLSSRASYQFMAINCAAIPDTLLETELFGVEAGAFTDARASRAGHLLRADGGTLFLDEIGSMPLALQAKLLRFLETRSFRRVGGTRELHVDLRVISATNVDLQTAVTNKTFRDDLFYRLKVITIHLPPLRERPEDIPALAEHFLQTYADMREHPLILSQEALDLLQSYPWPGNVRELRSVIHGCQILCNGPEILADDLPENIRKARQEAIQHPLDLCQQMHLPPEGIDLRNLLSTIEHTLIQEALDRCNGNQVHAAALLHITRDQLRYRLPPH